jgi:hypothetical protein
LESVLAVGIGDDGIHLRPDDSGSCLSAEGRLTAATAERLGLRWRWILNSVIFVFIFIRIRI